MIKETRAYGIFSGGLDSLLAARLLMDQGLTPVLITFTSPFFSPAKARDGAAQLNLTLREVDIYADLLPLIKKPHRGLGRNMNPCIDCHALMFKKAGDIMEAEGGGFLFSGEVLGQRPMSQNSNAMQMVAKDSGRREFILRPLSAKILPMTAVEEKGLVDRELLLGLSGRGRRPQMELAAQYGLTAPAPAGGCLLTDVGFANRLRWLLRQPQAQSDPAWPPARLTEALKHGRLFSAEPGQWLIVGRNQADNEALADSAAESDVIFHLEGSPGPTVFWPRSGYTGGGATLSLGRSLAAAYGDHGGAPNALVRMKTIGGLSEVSTVPATKPADWEPFMVKATD